jgi:SAM-dependent methyltransferase
MDPRFGEASSEPYASLLAAGRALRREAPGLWTTPTGDLARSYPDRGNELCFAVEDGSVWFRHRNRCLRAILSRYPPPGVVLDVGGGNGYVTRGLRRAGYPALVLEPGRQGVDNAFSRGLQPVIWGSLEAAGFEAGTVPAIGLFDVLEHIEDDEAMLQRIADLLVPGGRLFLTVPCHRFLWSAHDIAAGHFRRYTRRELVDRVAAAGLRIRFTTGLFAALVPVILLLRVLPFRLGLQRSVSVDRSIGDQAEGRRTAPLLEATLQLERRWLERGGSVPPSSSLALVAERPGATTECSGPESR